MKLSEYISNDKVECKQELSKPNWDRIFAIRGDEILSAIEEGYNKIEFRMVSMVPRPQDIDTFRVDRWKNMQLVQLFTVCLTRPLTGKERKQYGRLALGVSKTFSLPKEFWFTAMRMHLDDLRRMPKGPKQIAIDGKKYNLVEA